MTKEVCIVDYEDERKVVLVKDFEKVTEMRVNVISGDEILIVEYADGTSVIYDSNYCRCLDYSDGFYALPLDRVDEFSNLQGSSYDRLDHFRPWHLWDLI